MSGRLLNTLAIAFALIAVVISVTPFGLRWYPAYVEYFGYDEPDAPHQLEQAYEVADMLADTRAALIQNAPPGRVIAWPGMQWHPSPLADNSSFAFAADGYGVGVCLNASDELIAELSSAQYIFKRSTRAAPPLLDNQLSYLALGEVGVARNGARVFVGLDWPANDLQEAAAFACNLPDLASIQ